MCENARVSGPVSIFSHVEGYIHAFFLIFIIWSIMKAEGGGLVCSQITPERPGGGLKSSGWMSFTNSLLINSKKFQLV